MQDLILPVPSKAHVLVIWRVPNFEITLNTRTREIFVEKVITCKSCGAIELLSIPDEESAEILQTLNLAIPVNTLVEETLILPAVLNENS